MSLGYNIDVTHDRFVGITGKAEDVSGIRRRADGPPSLQHLLVFDDPVLLLFCRHQVVGFDVLEADEGAGNTSPPGSFNEVLNPVAERVHLDSELDVNSLYLPQFDQPVEVTLPILGAGEIVVVDKESADALGEVFYE